MLNRITIMGRLVANPELRYTPKGTPVCSIRIACDREVKNADGEYDTDFIDVVAWRSVLPRISRGALPRAAWPSLTADCKFGPGRTGTASATTPRKSWPTASTLATAVPPPKRRMSRPRRTTTTTTMRGSCPSEKTRGGPSGLPLEAY